MIDSAKLARTAVTAAVVVAGLCLVTPAVAHPAGPSAATAFAPRIPGVVPDVVRYRLYVSTLVGTNNANVYAYKLLNGHISTTPALDYTRTVGPLMVGAYGQLFAGNEYSTFSSGITAFYQDTTTQARYFFPPLNSGCTDLYVTSMASGSDGTIFIGYYCFISGLHGRHIRPNARHGVKPNDYPMQGVYVYNADSTTGETLLNTIGMANPPNGLSVDAAGNLYASQANEIDVFASPRTTGTQVRTIFGTSFAGSGRSAGGLWIDALGELYVFDSGVGSVSGYHDTVNGTVAPDRTILGTTTNTTPYPYIAVHYNFLYVTYQNGSFTGVEVFDKRFGGTHAPLQTLSVPNIFLGIGLGV
jgi:hypothetical protein